MGKRLILVGGGHAHMVTLANLHNIMAQGHTVTVIGPSEHHYYSGMGPGMLGQTYTPADIRFATRQVVEKQGATFVLDSVTHIDPEKKTVYLAAGEPLSYDVLSFNAGSYVDRSKVTDDQGDIFSVKPIEKLLAAQKRILELSTDRRITIDIVGGGPSSAEVAGNIIQLVKRNGGYQPEIRIFSGSTYMKRFPEKVRNKVRKTLTKRGVKIIEAGYVKEIRTHQVILANDKNYKSDLIFLALGVKPSKIFAKSNLPIGPDGGLLVNHYLQSTEYPELFGGGDCIYFQEQPLDKVGVYAVRENPVLYHNLLAALNGGELQAFEPGGAYLLIFNAGEGEGILHKWNFTFSGKLAFTIKDAIDRKFMRDFHAIE